MSSHAAHAHADAWHHHDPTLEGLPAREHTAMISAAVVTKWTLALTVLVVIFIVGVLMFFSHEMTRLYNERQDVDLSSSARAAREQARAELGSYGWADTAAGRVRVPMDLALERVVAAYAGAPASSSEGGGGKAP